MCNWKQQLKKSEVYVLVITENFFTEVDCFDQASYAKELGLPFRIAMLEGMEIPKGYPISDDADIEYHDGSFASIQKAISKLMNKDYPDGEWEAVNDCPFCPK